jgi:tRNA(Ile)-lysidine synthase
MLQEFIAYIEREKLIWPGRKTLLAVSGGMDSVAMAWLFHQARLGFAICHANFALRGDESDMDELFVKKLAEDYGVAFYTKRFDTNRFARREKVSVQVAARRLRYEWFGQLLDENGLAAVATAHHRDDQAETFLINLVRGTGIAGLHGIPPRNGRIIRPMMFTDRQEISRLVEEQCLKYRDDSSNTSLKYLRNRVRHRIIPELEKANPAFRSEIQATIQRIREAEIIYRAAVDRERSRLLLPDGDGFRISVYGIKELNPLETWLFEMISAFGFNKAIVSDIAATLESGPGRILFSASHQLLLDRKYLLIQPITTADNENEAGNRVYFIPEGIQQINYPVCLELKILEAEQFAKPEGDEGVMLDLDLLSFPLIIRPWRRGDSFVPLGMEGRKKLSDFFIDRKLSRFEKEKAWLLCSGNDIAWVIGMRPDERFKVTAATRRILSISRTEPGS